MRGHFITFEGGEGAGKSTHSKLLAGRLKAAGHEVVLTREPGGSPGAEVIRHIILSGAAKPLGAEAETMLFASARDDHLRTTIRPALQRGAWVLCDRFADSTRVYQGIVGEVDLRLIEELERITVGDTVPDLTFVLDVPADVGVARTNKRRGGTEADRFESEALDYHEKLRAGFRAVAESQPGRCVLIDVTAPEADVAAQIWSIVEQRLHPAAPVRNLGEAPP
jgi:dTMP kinase